MTMENAIGHGPQPWMSSVEYSQAVAAGGLLFVSGQYGSDDEGRVVSDDIVRQTVRAFENLRGVLRFAGSSLGDLVQVRCYLADAGDFDVYKEVRRRFLRPPWPASVVVEVKGFTFPGMKIELEAVARAGRADRGHP